MFLKMAKIHLSVLEVYLISSYPQTVTKFWKSERHSKGKDVGMEHLVLGVITQIYQYPLTHSCMWLYWTHSCPGLLAQTGVCCDLSSPGWFTLDSDRWKNIYRAVGTSNMPLFSDGQSRHAASHMSLPGTQWEVPTPL